MILFRLLKHIAKRKDEIGGVRSAWKFRRAREEFPSRLFPQFIRFRETLTLNVSIGFRSVYDIFNSRRVMNRNFGG